MNVSLPKPMEEFVHKKVAVGDYETASEVVRDGLRLLKQREAIWTTDLQTSITHGMDSVRSDHGVSSANGGAEIVVFKASGKSASDRSASAALRSHLDHTCFGESIWSSIGKSLHLPKRELQIVQHVFDDHKEAWIAQVLRISPHTVNTYLQRIYHKLRVFSRAQLVLRVVIEVLSLDLQKAMGDEKPTFSVRFPPQFQPVRAEPLRGGAKPHSLI